MKYLLILLSFFYFISSTAQDFTSKDFVLKWEDNALVHIEGSKTWHMPVVEGNGADYEKMLPIFIEKWLVPNNSKIAEFEITNIVFENITSKALLDIEKINLPSKINARTFVRSTREETHGFVELSPLIKDGSTYKKLKSFTLRYKLGVKPKSKSVSTVSSSVLATGDWYKFSTSKTGVYKITRSFLEDLGIDVGNVDPRNISIYGNGGVMLPYRIGDFRQNDLAENAIYFHGENDGNFDSDDYILFYAKGPDDFVHNDTAASMEHRINIFSNNAYYFVHVGVSPGKRIVDAPIITDTPTLTLSNYDAIIFHEKEKRNISEMGQQWQGESFNVENVQHFNMDFDNVDTSHPVNVKVRAVASSGVMSYATVNANGIDLYTLNIPVFSDNEMARASMAQADVMLTTSSLDVKISFNAIPSAKTYLDYIEVKGKKLLKANAKQFNFRNFDAIGNITRYNILNASNIYQVWNVTDNTTPQRIANLSDDGVFSFVANNTSLDEYIVVNSSDYYTPTLLENSVVANQNLHALENVDYVIITKQFLVDEAEEIAKYHREHSGLNVKTIPLYQIYNEFGSGAPDITAIRDFIKHLYDNSVPKLQYVLLFGDASYDYKNIEGKGENIVPSFEYYESFGISSSYVTDDFFAIVSDDEEGDIQSQETSNTQDVAISRIPVRSEAEACAVTSKILNYYEKATFGDWRNKVIIMADDSRSNSFDKTFKFRQDTIIANGITTNKPIINLKKMYADAYSPVITAGGARYPSFNIAFDDAIENGVLMMDYYGHGGEDGLADERLLGTDQIRNWNNTNTLPLFVIISCEFARFDNPKRPNTAGELTIRNPHGGVASQIATARSIGVGTGEALNNDIVPRLLEFDGVSRSVAENLRLSKNANPGRSQRMFVFSFGDPAMHLAVPKPNVKITHMNGTPVESSLDQIKALSHVYFKGVVTDESGSILTDYNGTMAATVYDKIIEKETLDNGYGDTMSFDTQESKIFRGQATVTNGEFSFDFVAPRDIRIAVGKGKLSFYSDNSDFDKGGYNLDIDIGGVNEDAPEDNSPPTIRLYMDNESFVDGGSTSKNPLFLAFLEDENGINTSITAVDHDIVATLDDDHLNTIILNDYYNTELDDFTKGSLEYTLRNLEPGDHTLHLKAYDTYNNKSEATLNFTVIDDSELVLSHVLNYPNPFINYTEFWFNHNKPNEPLEVQIQIFTVSGKLVKTINQYALYSCDGTIRLPWNGLDDFGEKIGKGVYIYKLKVKATLSGVVAEKLEKLVILQ